MRGEGPGGPRRAERGLKLTAPSTASHSTFLNIFNCCASFHSRQLGEGGRLWGAGGLGSKG